ncbi:MAG: sugar transferase [Clostridia bacterium]
MKRLFDFICSLVLLIILSPILAIIALVILIDDGPPVIFRQNRVGKDERIFKIYKFRTMKNGTRNAATHDLVESESAVTRSGKGLRKLSLDELPQLVNIVKGDMSFVGPRPLIPEEKGIRALRRARGVYSVRPGVTGWSQVNGRDLVDDETKAKMDQEYVQRRSLFFDLKILLKTVVVVLKRDGIAEGGEQAHEAPNDQK